MVTGFDLEGVTAVKFCDGQQACSTAPLSLPASLTVRATVPSLHPQSTLSASLLEAGGGTAATVYLNTPQVDWFQGAGGATPSQGGGDAVFGHHLRLLGRSLAWQDGQCLPFTRQTSQPPVRVVAVESATGATVPFPGVTFASCYRVDVLVPETGLKAGVAYSLHLDNGLTGPGIGSDGTSLVVPSLRFQAEDWPPALFHLNVTGAVNPSPNCNSVPQCLASAAAAGGGTVVVPPGTFTVCENWSFPDGTALVGAGRGITVFWWHAWCGTAVTFDPRDPNSSGGLPIISGLPGARWRMSDMDLYGQAWGGHGYQPPLGTDFVGLGVSNSPVNAGSGGYGGSSARITRVNISFDLRMSPQAQLGNAFSAYGASDFSLTDSFLGHWGSCSAQWPHNTIMHITNSSNGEIAGNVFEMGCQAAAIESSARMFLADNAFREVPVWGGTGIGSSNGGFEWSTIDPPHVSEWQYMGNSTYVGRWDAFERWESFTTDGGADAFYNETALSQEANPDGTATLVLASPVFQSVFFYTWHRGNVVSVMQGPAVGQFRRLLSVASDNVTILVDRPFDPPLGPEDILSITSFRGGYTHEGNQYFNGTVFAFYGGVYDSIVSGNTFDEM